MGLWDKFKRATKIGDVPVPHKVYVLKPRDAEFYYVTFSGMTKVMKVEYSVGSTSYWQAKGVNIL